MGLQTVDSLNLLQQCVALSVSVLFREHIKALPLGVISTRESPDLDSVPCSPDAFCPFSSISCVSLNLCLPECSLVNLSLCLFPCACPCLSLEKGFALCLLKNMESIMWERNELFYRNMWQSLPGIKLRTPTDPYNKEHSKQHCLSSNICMLSSKLMVVMHFMRPQPLFLLLLANYYYYY